MSVDRDYDRLWQEIMLQYLNPELSDLENIQALSGGDKPAANAFPAIRQGRDLSPPAQTGHCSSLPLLESLNLYKSYRCQP